jgi:nucleotide-binding universal stress UspA family protein
MSTKTNEKIPEPSIPGRPFERIIVALDGSWYGLVALEAAVIVAAALHAELVGLFVEDINLLRLAQLPFAQEVSYLAATPRKLDEAGMTRQLQARAAQAQQQLMHTAEKKEVRWSFHVARGLVADELLDATPATDLLVLGRVSRPRALKPVLGSTAQVVVARATHSILLIPPGADLERPVLVLYDGSAGARRALILAGKLAQTTGRLRVLIWAADDDTAEQFRSDVVAQLAGFDVDLSYRRLHQDERLQLADIVKRSAVGLFVLAGGETEVPPEAIQVLLEACDLPVLVVR